MPRKIRRFQKDNNGTTAIEFGILGGPFFLLLFAIIETSIYFYAGQALESGMDQVGRLIRTGQLDNQVTEQVFRQRVCEQVSTLFDCDDIHTSMQVVAEFDQLDDPEEPTNMADLTSRFDPVLPEQIVMLTVMYEWPIVSNYVASALSSLDSGNALLTSVTVFKTEPWPVSE